MLEVKLLDGFKCQLVMPYREVGRQLICIVSLGFQSRQVINGPLGKRTPSDCGNLIEDGCPFSLKLRTALHLPECADPVPKLIPLSAVKLLVSLLLFVGKEFCLFLCHLFIVLCKLIVVLGCDVVKLCLILLTHLLLDLVQLLHVLVITIGLEVLCEDLLTNRVDNFVIVITEFLDRIANSHSFRYVSNLQKTVRFVVDIHREPSAHNSAHIVLISDTGLFRIP